MTQFISLWGDVMILNNADSIKLGAGDVDKVYLGAAEIWSRSSYNLPQSIWEQGGITEYGAPSSRNDRIRARGFYALKGHRKIKVTLVSDNPMQYGPQFYVDNGGGTMTSGTAYEGQWTDSGAVADLDTWVIPADATHFRVAVRYPNNGVVSVSDLINAKYELL